jgi:hypothetical protein
MQDMNRAMVSGALHCTVSLLERPFASKLYAGTRNSGKLKRTVSWSSNMTRASRHHESQQFKEECIVSCTKPLRHLAVLLQRRLQQLLCHIAQLAQVVHFAKAQQPGWESCQRERLAEHLHIRRLHKVHHCIHSAASLHFSIEDADNVSRIGACSMVLTRTMSASAAAASPAALAIWFCRASAGCKGASRVLPCCC